MGFIIKSAFWLFVALAALPSFAPGDVREATAIQIDPIITATAAPDAAGAAAVSATGASGAPDATWMGFVSGLVFDVATLCVRQPGVCEQGSQLVEGALVRAEHGLRIAHAMIIQHRQQQADG